MELEPHPEFISLIYQILSNAKWEKLISLCPQVQVSFEQGKFCVIGEIPWSGCSKWECLYVPCERFRIRKGEDNTHIFCTNCNGQNHEEYNKAPVVIKHHLHPKHYIWLVFSRNYHTSRTRECSCCDEDLIEVFYYCSACDFAMNIACVEKPPVLSMDPKLPESKLISLFTQLLSLKDTTDSDSDSEPKPKFISLITQIISWISSTNFDTQPKPESKLMSLVTQTITLFNSIDLDSQPKPLSQLISIITQIFNSKDLDMKFKLIMVQTLELEPEPELMSLIHQILCLVISMNPEWKNLISLSPQVYIYVDKDGKFHVQEEVQRRNYNKWHCLPGSWDIFRLTTGEDATHFLCRSCNGENHGEYNKAHVEIKQPLHPKHSLQLVLFEGRGRTRNCYCCDEDLKGAFYYCSACDFAMNIACVEKPPVLSTDQPKWHEHTLAHFPRHAPITCDLCAWPDFKSSPIYMCPLCDFVVHQSCINLPRVIRISRHFHRISFTLSFDQGNWYCGVCRKKIDNDYGGYSCNKCSYVAHSKCATRSNVWDGIELEGEPEEIEEEVEPFLRISDVIIEHFSHQHHHLRLDENTGRDYDDKKECQACITPIYFGNFYSCLQCDFILHETCANLSRKIYHPIHPHLLTLVGRKGLFLDKCAACPYYCTAGFFYDCGKGGCRFKLHVQCSTIFEPLVHGSHSHPLFLTSKPNEQRRCSVCHIIYGRETFNCIECECDFALCFECATIPQKVRYKHDKHILTLSYGEDTNIKTYWCEVCESKIKPKERFYMCDEYCCVTLHIKCLIGKDLYIKYLFAPIVRSVVHIE